MLKFTRSGWNNIIIFSVMAFIVVINLTQKNIFNDNELLSTQQVSLLGDHNIILSLTVNQQTNIERIGATWRALPNVLQGQPLEAMMDAWHKANGVLVEKPADIDKSKAIMVSVVLAGQDQHDYFLFLPTAGALLIYQQSHKQWLSLPLPLFDQLLPNQVL